MRYTTNARQPKLRATFYRSGSGREPVRDWLLSLPKEERRQIGKDIVYMQYKWPIDDIWLAEKRWKEWQHGNAE